MNNYPFLNFVFLQIYTNKTKHLSIFLIATILIAVLSSFLFISNSISKDIKTTMDNQPDFIVQKIRSGKVVDIPNEWIDELSSINGITNIQQRVYGQHYYEPAEQYFVIIGIDLYNTQIASNLQKVMQNIDINDFLAKQNMIIGDGVKTFLDQYHYFDYYTFRPPDRSIKKVYIYDTLPHQSDIVSSDNIIMNIDLAKKILGIEDDYSSDIIFNVPNQKERTTIIDKIKMLHFDTRIIQKEDILKSYSNFFNYRSTIFLLLYTLVLITFILIIYQRYSYINSVDKKEIGVLRALGWSINDVIRLKIVENLIIFISAFILGINLAYSYLFIFNAPLLKSIFLGFSNLPVDVVFYPNIDFGILFMIFIFFIVPIIAAILIPVWRLSTIEPYETMR